MNQTKKEADSADVAQNKTIIANPDAEEAERKRASKEKREEIKRRIEQKRIEREKKKEQYNKLSLFDISNPYDKIQLKMKK